MLKEVTITKEDSPLVQYMTADITNGEIFLAARELQNSAARQGAKITNIGQVYHWAIEKRDMLKAG
jgi:hypothetical protein